MEAIVALSTLLIGLMGFASLQVMTVRSNQFARRLAQASELAMDLEESIKLWTYADTRLNTTRMVTSMIDPTITSRWDMGRGTLSSYQADYSEKASDSNAALSSALTLGGAYPGLSGDVDGDGKLEFIRYWSVTAVDISSTGTANGKLVQIIVRWFEPGVGYRQVTSSSFKLNPAYAFH
jgi:hypothetical protein